MPGSDSIPKDALQSQQAIVRAQLLGMQHQTSLQPASTSTAELH